MWDKNQLPEELLRAKHLARMQAERDDGYCPLCGAELDENFMCWNEGPDPLAITDAELEGWAEHLAAQGAHVT